MNKIGKTIQDGEYVEWLNSVDQDGGEFAWINKRRDFPRNWTGIERSPGDIRESVIRSRQVQDAIVGEAARRGCPTKEVYLEVKEIVTNMAQEFSLPAVKAVGYGVVKVIKRLFDAIYVNMAQLRRLRSTLETDSIILMPTHKTYVDFLLISLLCYHEDFTLPAIAAGADFQQSLIMGEALRRCGAFFLRRTFGKDKLYWAVFSEYVQNHLVHSDRPVEFFIEGTRSRTGKALHPKYGFLQMILEPYLRAEVYDLVIVPVTMNYDKMLEESLYAYELLGFQKPKETTSGLLKARHILNESFGNIYVTFAEPISVRNYLEPKIDRNLLSFLPEKQFTIDSTTKSVIRKFGHEIIQIHNSNNIISLWPIASFVIAELIEESGFSLTKNVTLKYSQILKRSIEVRDVCEKLLINIQIHNSPDEDLRRLLKLHSDLFIKFDFSSEDFDLTLTEMLIDRDSRVSKHLLQKAVTSIVFANYSNQIMPFLAELCYIASSLQNSEEDEKITVEELKTDFQFFEKLFDREFITVPGETQKKFYFALERLKHLNIVRVEQNLVFPVDNEVLSQLNKFLMPFIRSYSLNFGVLFSLAPRLHLLDSKTIIPALQSEIAKALEEDIRNNHLRLSFLSSDLVKNSFHQAVLSKAIIVKAWHALELDKAKMNSLITRLNKFNDSPTVDSIGNSSLRSRL